MGGQQRPGAGGLDMGVLLKGKALSVAEDLQQLCAEQVNDDNRRLQAKEGSVPCAWGRRQLPAGQSRVREEVPPGHRSRGRLGDCQVQAGSKQISASDVWARKQVSAGQRCRDNTKGQSKLCSAA